MAISTIGTNSLSDPIAVNGYTPTASNMQPFNRIINGAMTIDQRNAGAAVTPTDGAYTLDRWSSYQFVAGKFSIQQNAGSVTPPVGFSNYLGVTSLSAYTVLSGGANNLQQVIEGFNTADLQWGTANAKTITLSFQVYSSLTGTFGGAILNSGANRSYPFSYTISSANTWTSISITIAGDTSGTWIGATSGKGLSLSFGLGVGSTFSGTAGSWAAAQYFSATGATSVVATSGATFYITGVQLEVGSSGSSFAHENYSDTLQKCQRYFQASIRSGTTLMLGAGGIGGGNGTGGIDTITPLVVAMRANPTITVPTVTNGYFAYTSSGTTTLTNNGEGVSSSPTMISIRFSGFSSQAVWTVIEARQDGAGYTASAEL